MKRSGAFEGQRNDRKAIADRVATYGLKVVCTDCGLLQRHRPGYGGRLRHQASRCCKARMHPVRWKGWEVWRVEPRHSRREEPVPTHGEGVVGIGGQFYMVSLFRDREARDAKRRGYPLA